MQVNDIPSYIDPELWSAFCESRKAMKVPFTPLAQKLVVRKLMKMHAEGWDANASLEKSAVYGYRGVFEVARLAAKETAYEKTIRETQKRDEGVKPMPMEVKQKIAELRGRVNTYRNNPSFG